jgi:hypothetical protein
LTGVPAVNRAPRAGATMAGPVSGQLVMNCACSEPTSGQAGLRAITFQSTF